MHCVARFSRSCALGFNGPDSQLFTTFCDILGWVVDAYKELANDRELLALKKQLAKALRKADGSKQQQNV